MFGLGELATVRIVGMDGPIPRGVLVIYPKYPAWGGRRLCPSWCAMGRGLEHQCRGEQAPGAIDHVSLHREVPEPRLERHVPHHSRSLSVKAAILEKVGQARRVQRAKQLAEKHRLSQKALQRQNRACQRPLRRTKQHVGTFVHQPCQRHCNY